LVQSLREQGRDDAAYCVAHAGVFLLGADAPEPARAFAAEYRPPRPRRAEAPIDEEAWFKLLAHPDDDPYVAKVFECSLAAVRSVRSLPLAKAGLHAHDAAHPARSSVAVVRALGAAAFALDAPMPLTFVVPTREGAVEPLPTEPIASIAGGRVTSGRSLEELAFVAGHHMARYRPSQYVRALYRDSVPELTALFAATLRAARPSLAVDPSVARVAEQLRALLAKDAAVLARLERVVNLFVERGAPVDIARWVAGAERTSLRAGLLLSGDLAAAKSSLSLIDGAPDDALGDLTTFSMSDGYWALRQRLGIALWPDTPIPSASPPEHVRASPSFFPPPAELDEAIARAEAAEREEAAGAASEGVATAVADDGVAAAEALARDEALVVLAPPRIPSEIGEVIAPDERPAASSPWVGGPQTAVDRPTVVEPQPSLASRLDAFVSALAALSDPGETTELARWFEALVPALRATYGRAPSDFDVHEADAGSAFAQALAEAARWLGAIAPVVSTVENLGALWAAPPSTPALVLVDPVRDAALSSSARRWLAAECAALFVPGRLASRLAPTPMLLADAAVAVAQALGEPEGEASEGSSAHAVARFVLADPLLSEALGPLARRLAPAVFRDAAVRWWHAVERGAARQALAFVDDALPLDEAHAARPFRPGNLDAAAWRATVEAALTDPALSTARDARVR
jgi:hypothetical protein